MAFAVSHFVRLSPLRGSDEHTDTRIFSEQNLRSKVTQGNPRAGTEKGVEPNNHKIHFDPFFAKLDFA